MNLMCCPLCGDALWKKKNYPPPYLGELGRNRGCPWCGKPPRKNRYCDEWCREAIKAHASREYQRQKAENLKPSPPTVV
jgi:predicted nucleic acid-binding Zn ribbon protein